MRKPAESIKRLPQSQVLGQALRQLLEKAIEQYPSLLHTAKGIVDGSGEIAEMDAEAIKALRSAAGKLLEPQEPMPAKTASASSPLDATLLWGWGDLGDDPDAKLLASWVLQGAPLGFDQPITTTGVFPQLTGTPVDSPSEAELRRPWDEWENWPSAEEEHEALVKLVREAEEKGFCKITADPEVARQILGADPVLSKLGVIVKHQGENQEKKTRIIWDLRQSGLNNKCNPAERVVLPRLLDVVTDSLRLLKTEGAVTFAAVDIKDAFHNVPASSDRKYTVASAELEDKKQFFIIYGFLVFGSRSSPTIWGRFAALLGRILAATVPENRTHIYVDDPIL